MDIQKSEANYNMIDWFKKVVFNNYANFNGRARRSEYWWFAVCSFLIYVIPFAVLIFFAGNYNNEDSLFSFNSRGGLVSIALTMVYLALFIPSLAVAVRRLHDTNKSGWYFLLGLVPFGNIILLVFFFQDGNRYTNDYGPDPKSPYQNDFDFEQQANQSTTL